VLRLVRFALLVVLAFLVVGLVVALASPETGLIEKPVLALAIIGLLAAGVPVRRIGSQASFCTDRQSCASWNGGRLRQKSLATRLLTACAHIHHAGQHRS
jgi:hypothetical protein